MPNPFFPDDEDRYVVVCESDIDRKYLKENPDYKPAPIVFETFLTGATMERAETFQKRLAGKYGKSYIAKLVFIEKEKDESDS